MRAVVILLCFPAVTAMLIAQAQQPRPRPAAGTVKPAKPPAAAAAPAKPAQPTRTGATVLPVAGQESSLGLRFEPPHPMKAPAASEAALPNGLRYSVSENREIPVVNLFGLLRAGSVNDPAGKAGLAELTAMVARSGGAGDLTGPALQEKLDQIRAKLDAFVSESGTVVSLRMPPASIDAAGPILRDILTKPRLDPEAVDAALGQMHEAIGQRYQSPAASLTRLFRERLYGAASPWGRAPDYDSLDNITRADIEEFHRQHYQPGQAVIAVEGDIATADARAKVAAWFNTWPGAATGAAAAEPPMPAQPKPPARAFLFVDREDLRVTGLVLGHLSGRVSDPDFAAMQLLCEILAAGPDSRLPARVRAAGGWRADWSAAWEANYDRPGEFTVRASVESPFTTQSITIVKEELAKLREGIIADEELERARTRLLTRLAVRFQSSADQSRDRAAALLHGLEPDQLSRTYKTLATLTRAEFVKSVARNLVPDQIVVVAGNSKVFDKPLTSIASKVEPAELVVPAARPLKIRTDPASLERGLQALRKMQEALGGRAKLAAVQDMSIRQEGTTLIRDQTVNVKLWDRWMAAGVYRQDQEFGPLGQSIFFDGKIAWMGTQRSIAPLPGQLLAIVRHEIFRLFFRLALSDTDLARQVADLGGNVLQITEGEAQGVRVYLDPTTALPQRLLYRIDLGAGVSVSVEESLSDWKEFDGIKWPTHVTTRKNGRRADDITITEAKFNSGLKAADLERKP